MKKLLLVGIISIGSLTINAQGWISQGSRVSALSNNGVTFVDAFAFHHNPGALGFLENGTVGLSYESRYAIKELQTQGVAVAIPLKTGVLSAGGQFYGYNAYKTTRAGLGYSMKLAENFSAGIQINYLGMSFGSTYYGRKNGVSAEIGALAKLTDDISIGFSATNINRTKLSDFKDERFGTFLRFGISYQLVEPLLLVAEAEQEIGYNTRLRAGMEYHPIDFLYVRVGVQGAPMEFSFGFGLKFKAMKLDLGTQYDQLLGWSPSVSFIFDFQNLKQK